MAKYKVLKQFRDVHTKEVYEENQVIEMSEKRAEEAIKNLEKYDGEFLERIENKKDEKQQEKQKRKPKEKQEGDE